MNRIISHTLTNALIKTLVTTFITALIAALMIVKFSISPAAASPLLADLSNYRITIDSSFNGTRMFIFGTRGDNGDILIVVRGPSKNYMIRKKQEVAGMWINTERMKLFNVPQFYTAIGSRPFSEIEYNSLLQQLEIGSKTLFPAAIGNFNQEIPRKEKEFTEAFLQYQKEQGLYRYDTAPLSFMGETLFKTVVTFPDNIPPGTYNAEIYLLKKHKIVGAHILPIEIRKVGIDEFLYNYAHKQPVLYGITAVILALSAGWCAGRLFEKL